MASVNLHHDFRNWATASLPLIHQTHWVCQRGTHILTMVMMQKKNVGETGIANGSKIRLKSTSTIVEHVQTHELII